MRRRSGMACHLGRVSRLVPPVSVNLKGNSHLEKWAPRLPPLPPRRQGHRQDRETRRPPDGRHAILGRQWTSADAGAAETAASVDALAVPTRSGRVDGMTPLETG